MSSRPLVAGLSSAQLRGRSQSDVRVVEGAKATGYTSWYCTDKGRWAEGSRQGPVPTQFSLGDRPQVQ